MPFDMPYTRALHCAAVSSLADRREHIALKIFQLSSRPLILPLHPLTYPTGYLYHYSLNMCKQVPSHPHPYQKIPDIDLLHSVPLPICTFINCLFLSRRMYSMHAIQTFCVHLLLFRYFVLFYCVICSHDHQVE